MGYQVYRAGTRWQGYGVPAQCDYLTCEVKIHRGVAYLCEEQDSRGYFEEEGSDYGCYGCGRFFCSEHLYDADHRDSEYSPDLPEWENWMLTDESWEQWRQENPEEVSDMLARERERRNYA